MSYINRTIWVLSMVSLFMDMASEMLYPVIPVYLRTIGFSLFWIGLLEGLAEFSVSLTKGYFGHWSDRIGQRLPFIRSGYLLSALSKPLMALWPGVTWVFFSRTMDRLGKGMRSAARDALLSSATTKEYKARVFNFHRSWDTAGAVMGPLLALWLLKQTQGNYKSLFFLAFLPGIVSFLLLLLVKEKKGARIPGKQKGFFSYLSYYRKAPANYRKLVMGLVVFGLANSSDVFLLLRAREISGSDEMMLWGYIFYNIVYAASAFPLGMAADRWGYRRILSLGFLLFAMVYAGFSMNNSVWSIFLLLGIYGIYAAATEGVAKAWITSLVPAQETATALGFLGSVQSIAALAASAFAGLIWDTAGSTVVFLTASVLALTSLPLILRTSN